MKFFLTILLFPSIFWNILSEKTFNAKKINTLSKHKILERIKEKYRKLEYTGESMDSDNIEDSTDYESLDSSELPDNSTEIIRPTNDNKNASIQIMSFANVNKTKEQIQFNVFFYFLAKKIVHTILLPIKITYSQKKRNLQFESYEEPTTNSTCTIKNKSLVGQEGIGNIIDYNCEVNTTKEEEVEKVSLDIETPLITGDEKGITTELIDFSEVNFNGNSAQESTNIIENAPQVSNVVVLKETEVDFPVQISYFRLFGTPSPTGSLTKDEKMNITFLNDSNGEKKTITYQCFIKEIEPKSSIECDTQNNPINSTIQDFHLSSGFTNSKTMLTIEMKNWENNNTSIKTPISDNNKKENITADQDPEIVDVNTPISSEKKDDNKKANIQFNSFANYTRDNKNKKISFKTFFYFFKRTIVKNIIFRLRVNYLKPLRNLQQETIAESIPCECNIINETLVDIEASGNITGFNCEATTLEDANLTKVVINTDIPMIIKSGSGRSQTIEFDDINFNGISSSQSENIQDIKNISNSGFLEDAEVEMPIHINYFKISGKLNPENLLNKGDVIPITFLDNTYDLKSLKEYQCTITQITPKCTMECDTRNQPITSTIQNFHLSSGISNSNNLLTIQMKNWENNNTPIESNINIESASTKNRKNSGGLTKGAIAGIVIACVAVVAAVIITILMCRKTTPVPLASNMNSANSYFESVQKF